MNLIDYTKKKVISLKDTKKIIDTDITRVRTISKMAKGWFLDSRVNGKIYANNPVIRVKGVARRLRKCCGETASRWLQAYVHSLKKRDQTN